MSRYRCTRCKKPTDIVYNGLCESCNLELPEDDVKVT